MRLSTVTIKIITKTKIALKNFTIGVLENKNSIN